MEGDTGDVWQTFSNLHHSRELSETYWAGVPEFQAALTAYLKAKIDAGFVNGETSLPPNLVWHEFVWSFPEEMRKDLYAHAESVLESNPSNGAAAKFAAIVLAGSLYDVPQDGFWNVAEQAMGLLPNDVELCYLTYEKASFESFHHKKAIIALERLFVRHQGDEGRVVTSRNENHLPKDKLPTLSQWVYRFCWDNAYVTMRPTDFYQRLKDNHLLKERWIKILGKIQNVFEEQLEREPDDWSNTRMLFEIHETLGNTEAAQAVLQKLQLVFEDRLKLDANDKTAWDGLARIHEWLGNTELAHAYRVNADPTLAWIGRKLPDFSAFDIDGKSISLENYRDKLVLLYFWKTKSDSCAEEMQNIKEIYGRYHHIDFEVISVNLDEDETMLHEFINENQLSWRHIFDSAGWESPIVQRYGVRRIPTSFLIDRKGEVISVKARGNALRKLVRETINR